MKIRKQDWWKLEGGRAENRTVLGAKENNVTTENSAMAITRPKHPLRAYHTSIGSANKTRSQRADTAETKSRGL
ncbi:hypothetical protein M404DRAFT_994945 [Pisolithus tinctorius Marx 270]|uniref:Uncharacterized protein n=1 Tax=Pisolithus tinctorius Marx 270 TaxID=870435 RepID=A0A0C3KNT6_PISTI|nr:hypothetical protein M404DRAFT_994945 [Pisolithus tinctorius Marx 270]